MSAATAHFVTKPPAAAVIDLLRSSGLPTADLTSAHFDHFLVAGTPTDPSGVVGIEIHGQAGLLRSLAVRTDARGQGGGARLVAAIEDHARAHGVCTVYLLTTTAESFFAARGYRTVAREDAPAAIRATHEFASLCPASAVCMSKSLIKPTDPSVQP